MEIIKVREKDKTVYYKANSDNAFGMREFHREDGPAVVYDDGDKFWYQNDNLHREDGPAYEGADGTKHWWAYGLRHRLDGPAIEDADGTEYFFIDGKHYTKEEFLKKTGVLSETLLCPGQNGIPGQETSTTNLEDQGITMTTTSICGIAVLTEYRNHKGQLHRLDGPAYITPGLEIWFENGKKHRLDGPAIASAAIKKWFLRDEEYDQDTFGFISAC